MTDSLKHFGGLPETDKFSKEDAEFMQKAIELSIENVADGGGPFGAVIVKDGENIILRNGWWKKKIPITNITRVELLSKERENTIKLLLNPETVRLYYKTEAGEKIYEVCDVRNKEKAIERLNELIAN